MRLPGRRPSFVRLVLAGWVMISLSAMNAGYGPQLRAESGPRLTHGVAVGDVTERSAVLWARADGPAQIGFELSADPDFTDARLVGPTPVDADSDYILQPTVEGLTPDTLYFYRAWAERDGERSPFVEGRFRTPPPASEPQAVTLLWSADLGGQTWCRRPEYSIFRSMDEVPSQIFLMLGDTIYADEICPSPPNLPGSGFNAVEAMTLEAYRAKHRYNRADPAYLDFLSDTPIVATWDDHEVRNNFAGQEGDPRTPLGRQAFLEYYPISHPPEDPNRIYRSLRWGRHLELFVLDTRQYRSPDAQEDGPEKTMLGSEQLTWLKERLERSDATWKVIGSSVPLSRRVGCPEACDGWANAGGRTGFERELLDLVDGIRQKGIRNLIWLTGDIHFPQAVRYDVDGDGSVDFYEFTAGPLSASRGVPSHCPDPTLNPTVLYASLGKFFNFGVLHIDPSGAVRVEIRDAEGLPRYQMLLDPLHPQQGQSGDAPQSSSALLAHWPFERGEGEIVQDASGRGHDGRFQGEPEWAEGRIGGGLRFDGVDDWVLVPCHPDFNVRDGLTISLWAFLEADPDAGPGNDWRLLLGREGFRPYGLLLEQNRILTGSVSVGGERRLVKSSGPLPLGVWTHLAFTYEGETGTARLYINGRLDGERVFGAGRLDIDDDPIRISMKSGIVEEFHAWPGRIDEVRLYGRALSPEEIEALFRNP